MILAAADFHGNPALIVGLEGAAQRVDWQAAEFSRRVAAEGITSPPIELSENDQAELVDWPATMAESSNSAARIACLTSELETIVSGISAIPGVNILADCAVGTLQCTFERADCGTVAAVRGLLPIQSNCVWTLLDFDGDCVASLRHAGKTLAGRAASD